MGVGRGQRINQQAWPPSGAHRKLLELLDRVHVDNGVKSLADIAAGMHLKSRTRVSDLLRGTGGTLPADDRQLEQLVRALGGGNDEVARGTRLFRAAEAEARSAAPARSTTVLPPYGARRVRETDARLLGALNDRLRRIYLEKRQTRRMVILAGAGVSFAASRDKLALWPDLLHNGLQYGVAFGQGTVDELWRDRWAQILEGALETGRVHELALVGEAIQSLLLEVGEMQKWMNETIGSLSTEHHQLLDVLGATGVPLATVNYDRLLDKHLGRGTLEWSHGAALQWPAGPRGDDVLHIHGDYSNATNIVLGVRSYERSTQYEPIQQVLRNLAIQHTLLFVGWGSGLRDPNFGALFDWLRAISPLHAPPHFILVPTSEAKPLQRQLGAGHPVQVVPYGDNHDELVPYLQELVGDHSYVGYVDANSILDVRRHLETARSQYARGPRQGGGYDFFLTPAFAAAAQMAKEWVNDLSGQEHAFLLRGSLYIGQGQGFGLYEFLPEPNADWAMGKHSAVARGCPAW